MEKAMEEFIYVVVLLHGAAVEKISRIEYGWLDHGLRILVHEVPLSTFGFASEKLHAILRAYGEEFVSRVAERLFRHAGFEFDIGRSEEKHLTMWFRKKGGR